jgi:hypothetical protein
MQLLQIQTRNVLGHGLLNISLNGSSSRTKQLHKRRFSHSTDATINTVFMENDDELSINDLDEPAANIIVDENISVLLSSTSTIPERKCKRRRFDRRCSKSSNMLVKDVGVFLRQHFTEKENTNDENKSTESLIKETMRLMKSIKLASSLTRSTI